MLAFLERLALKVQTDCPRGKAGYITPKAPLPTKDEVVEWQWLLRNKVIWELRLTQAAPVQNGVPAQLQCLDKEQMAEHMQEWVISDLVHGMLPSVRLSVLRTLQIPASSTPGLLQHACKDDACRDPACLGNRLEKLDECYSMADEYSHMHPLLGDGWRALQCVQQPAVPSPAHARRSGDGGPLPGLHADALVSSAEDDDDAACSDGQQTSSGRSSSAPSAGDDMSVREAHHMQTGESSQQRQAVSIADMFAAAGAAVREEMLVPRCTNGVEPSSSGTTSMQTAASESFTCSQPQIVPKEPAAAVPALSFQPLVTGLKKLRLVIVHHKCEDDWGKEAVSFILPFDLALTIALFLEFGWVTLNLGLRSNLLLTKPSRELPMDDTDMSVIWRRMQELYSAPWIAFPPSRLREASLGDTVADLAKAISKASPQQQAVVFGTATVMTNTIRVWPHYVKNKVFNELVKPCLEHLSLYRKDQWSLLAGRYKQE